MKNIVMKLLFIILLPLLMSSCSTGTDEKNGLLPVEHMPETNNDFITAVSKTDMQILYKEFLLKNKENLEKYHAEKSSYAVVEETIWGESSEGGTISREFMEERFKAYFAVLFGETGKTEYFYYNFDDYIFLTVKEYTYNSPFYFTEERIAEMEGEGIFSFEVFDPDKSVITVTEYMQDKNYLYRLNPDIEEMIIVQDTDEINLFHECTLKAATSISAGDIPLNYSPHHPVIVDDFLMGGFYDSQWVTASEMAGLEMEAFSYKLYSNNDIIGTGTGSNVIPDLNQGPYAERVEIVADIPVNIQNKAYLGLSSHHNPFIRPATAFNTENETYKAIINSILEENGLYNAPIHIMQIYSVDLEGDGVNEVFIYAQNIVDTGSGEWDDWASISDWKYSPPTTKDKDKYSILLLRKIVDGEVKNIILNKQIFLEQGEFSDGCPTVYKFTHFADLNNDGVIEVIIGDRYYEGYGYGIYEIVGEDFNIVLYNGWGA